MKYCFEMYSKVNELTNKFLGYKLITAESTEQAYLSAKESVGEDIMLAQIWIPQEYT